MTIKRKKKKKKKKKRGENKYKDRMDALTSRLGDEVRKGHPWLQVYPQDPLIWEGQAGA